MGSRGFRAEDGGRRASPGTDMAPEEHEYAALAELDYRIRVFLRSGDERARKAGLDPIEHQLLLAFKQCVQRQAGGLREVRERLGLPQQRIVDLVNRLVKKRLLERRKSSRGGRTTFLQLTSAAETALALVSAREREHLRMHAPELIRILHTLADGNGSMAAG